MADGYPNFSICGIPYYVSGAVGHWTRLAHRTRADLEAAGMRLLLDTTATDIDPGRRTIRVQQADGDSELLGYDGLVVGTGALPVRPPIAGLDLLGPAEGVHLLHSMGDAFALEQDLADQQARSALIVGAGYVGLEMAEGLTARGIAVTHYPGAQPVTARLSGYRSSGRLLGAQLVGRHGSEIAKRVDGYATALFHQMSVAGLSELDLSYTPPLGSPWDVVQAAAQGPGTAPAAP